MIHPPDSTPGSDHSGFPIPLHSDTASLPTAGMRAFMAAAPVGDEQRGEDPSVKALESVMAEALGHEAAVFLPSATMANQIAVRLHCRQGEEAICHELAHMVHWEAGSMAALSGVQPRLLSGPRGCFAVEAVEAALRGSNLHHPPTTLVAVENTTNMGGGACWALVDLHRLRDLATSRSFAMHCDGSRLMNAAVVRAAQLRPAPAGTPRASILKAAAELAWPFDTITVCCSKGLGAPVGAVLVGSAQLMARARRLKHQFGGAMRQAGIIAAGALYAFEHHLERLETDHHHARLLAAGLRGIDGLTLPDSAPETNIVMPEIGEPIDPNRLAEDLRRRGVGCFAYGRRVRFVTHLGVDAPMIEKALETIREVIGRLRAATPTLRA